MSDNIFDMLPTSNVGHKFTVTNGNLLFLAVIMLSVSILDNITNIHHISSRQKKNSFKISMKTRMSFNYNSLIKKSIFQANFLEIFVFLRESNYYFI